MGIDQCEYDWSKIISLYDAAGIPTSVQKNVLFPFSILYAVVADALSTLHNSQVCLLCSHFFVAKLCRFYFYVPGRLYIPAQKPFYTCYCNMSHLQCTCRKYAEKGFFLLLLKICISVF